MSKMRIWSMGIILCLCGVLPMQGLAMERSPNERRLELLKVAKIGGDVAVAKLLTGLEDNNPIVRRTAVTLLIRLGESAEEALTIALTNSDPIVRAAAIRGVVQLNSQENALLYLIKMTQDPDSAVRLATAEILVALSPRSAQVAKLLTTMSSDPDLLVSGTAAAALWPFDRENVTLRESGHYDHHLEVIKTIELPLDGWRFAIDPGRNGHIAQWFEPSFDDSSWQSISIGKHWDDFGVSHEGIAWYRGTFTMPEQPAPAEKRSVTQIELAVDLMLGAVDEAAWVWLNGVYIGAHNHGLQGWNQPFAFDVTKEINWHGKNSIVVRVLNDAGAGGIWKPIKIEVVR